MDSRYIGAICGTLVCLAVPLMVSAQKRYEFVPTTEGFNVSIGSITVLHHTAAQPFVFVGNGQLTAAEFRGNFKMADYQSERVGLAEFNRTSTNGSDVLDMSCLGGKITATVILRSTPTHPLVVDVEIQTAAEDSDRLWVRVDSDPADHVYGGGEQYSYLDLKGRAFPIWVREQGVGRNVSELVTFFADLQKSGGDYHTTYFPQATFLSSRKYFCHVDTTAYSVMDFSRPEFHELQIYSQKVSLQFDYGADFPAVIKQLSRNFGRQPKLPAWLNSGAIIATQGGTDVMLGNVTASKQAGVLVSGVWIQDWAGSLKTSFGSRLFWNWRWNETVYPGLDKAIKSLSSQGVKVLVYINPNLNDKGDIFAEGDRQGFLLKDAEGKTIRADFGEFKCGTVDLTNPAAFAWYKELIKTNILDLGIRGWMADFGEYIPTHAVFANGKRGWEMHNEYPVLWARVNREAVEEAGLLGEVFFFMRAGFAGSQNYTVSMWAGDQNVDFSYGDGVGTTITGALSMGLTGMGFTHFDIGGYTTEGLQGLRRTPEVLLRSAEMAVFTPIMRTHEGNQPAFNAQFYSSPQILQQFARLTKIFHLLGNYTKTLITETSVTGLPVQRALFLHYPDDEITYNLKYQYMYGPELLVAPVYLANSQNWAVYLPSDHWTHFWTGKDYEGPAHISVPAPLGKPPVFYRKYSKWNTTFARIASTTEPDVPVGPSSPGSPGKAHVLHVSMLLSLLCLISAVFV